MNALHGLNEKQIEAVTHKDGPLLVIAGPGTGKTKVITHRIEHLIRAHNIRPENILAITFTNKAAEEMQERINTGIGEPHGSSVKACTFHAFCVKVLRKHALKIGLSENFTIFDQELQDEILTESVRALNLNADDYPTWWLRNIISDAKCTLRNPVAAVDNAEIDNAANVEDTRNVLESYQQRLAEYDALDFDDLLLKTVELLGVEDVKAACHQEISYILVDEFHDVNRAQYRLLQLLCAAPAHNLMVVADEDQSIYSWRGSNPAYINDFRRDFDPRTVELDDHYRCDEKILRAAEEVISRNSDRQKQHTLRTHKDAGRDIFHYTFETPIAEALGIIGVIQNLVTQRNYSYRDIAIFYRTHKLADALAEQLLRKNIKFQRILPTNSFGEGGSKGILACLRLLQWQLPQDVEQAINFPETCIDDLTWVRLKWLAEREHIPFMELLKDIEAYAGDVGPLTRRNVREFWTQLEKLSVDIKGEKTDKIILKLFDALEGSRSPYRAEELEVLEKQPELPNLVTARDVLYSALDLNEPIQITATHGIDAYCAAHIIHQTLETYLNRSAELQFLSPDENSLLQLSDGVHLLIGDFEVLGEKAQEARLILIGNAAEIEDSDVIHLETEGVRSIAALKLCQRLINRFESPNMADMVVYDLETTGINPKTAEIVEIAAHRLSAIGDEVERYYRLVKPPGGHIPRAATRIHQIDEETVKDAPGIEMVLPEFFGFIQDRILIGHNVAEYDNPILARDLRRYLKAGLSAPHYDTLVTARRLFPRQRCSIAALAEKFGIEHGRLHSALEDVGVNREIFKELIKIDAYKREVQSLPELLPLVGLGTLAKQEVAVPSDTLTETEAFLNAAKRFVQTHNVELPDRFPLETAAAAQARACMETLQGTAVPEFREDIEWRQRRIQFMNAVVHFESVNDEHELKNFLDYQKLLTNIDELDDKTEQLTLMTLHSAKGTEFRVVFIIGMEEGSFPMWQQHITAEYIEEERRLFYVGMTRAQNQLYLSSTVYRTGDRDRPVSMFVREVPSNYLIKWSAGQRI